MEKMRVNRSKRIWRKGFNIAYLKKFLVQKILLMLFAFSITASPSLAWGESGCSFSNKNKTSQEMITDKVENLDSTNK